MWVGTKGGGLLRFEKGRPTVFGVSDGLPSREQAKATRTVAGAVQAIAGISHQSSVGARESTLAAGRLVGMAERLASVIARFRTATG